MSIESGLQYEKANVWVSAAREYEDAYRTGDPDGVVRFGRALSYLGQTVRSEEIYRQGDIAGDPRCPATWATSLKNDWNDDQRRQLDAAVVTPLNIGASALLSDAKRAATLLAAARRRLRN